MDCVSDGSSPWDAEVNEGEWKGLGKRSHYEPVNPVKVEQ